MNSKIEYFKGDKAKRTGKKIKDCGVWWYEIKMLEGTSKGKLKYRIIK